MEPHDRTNEHPAGLHTGAALEKIFAALPLTTCSAGETVLRAGSKTGRLLILKKGAVAIVKDSIEIARVEHPGAVLGEISALLNQPHSADVRALVDSQFHVADAALLLEKDPAALRHVAKEKVCLEKIIWNYLEILVLISLAGSGGLSCHRSFSLSPASPVSW